MELLDILERLRASEPIRSIQRNTGAHKTIIREIRDLSSSKGWLNPSSPIPNEHELLEARYGSKPRAPHPLDQFKDDITRWKDKGHSAVVIRHLISDRYQCSESTIRRYLKQQFPKIIEPVAVREAIPGRVMEVDFGDVGLLYDPVTKKKRKAYVFSGRLNYSRIAWREIVFDQKQDTFFQCHIHAFEFFGGVPEIVVPDNLKAAVIKASHEDPLVNRAYRSMARHYGFRIDPCLPYTPQHKGGVENDVRYIKNNFFPIFRETQSSMGRDLPSIIDANKELTKWGDDIAHPRVIRDLGCRPIDLLDTEKAKLKPLPSQTWDQEGWTEHKVGRDWRIRHECSKYSVPCELITKRVTVCTTTKLVRIFHEGKEVTVHNRASEKNQDIWKESHAPVHKQAYMNVTRESLHQQAVSIGPETGKTVKLILDRPEVDGLRPARKLVALKDKFGSTRLESACKRANQFETSSYGSVKNILTKGLDRTESAPQLQSVEIRPNQSYRFARIFMLFSGLTLTISTQGEKLWMTLSF